MRGDMTAAEFLAQFELGRNGRGRPKSSADRAEAARDATSAKDVGGATRLAPAGERPAPNTYDGSEDDLQMEIIAKLCPHVEAHGGLLISADTQVRLGKRRGAIQQSKRKLMGARTGFPDLVAFDREQRAGFIELKSAKGRLRPEQEQFRDLCQQVGWRWALCRSVPETAEKLREWGMMA